MQLDPNKINAILPIKQSAEKKLVTMPGITGIDVGLKETGGERTNVYAIIVFVKKKGEYAPEDEIPKEIDGVPTDVVEAIFKYQTTAKVAVPAIDTNRYDPVQGGCCISPARFDDYYGSLGMIVRDKETGAPFWLGAYHVMCFDNKWPDPNVDRRIIQPAIDQGGIRNNDVIGVLSRGVHGEVFRIWGNNLYVDCAICSIDVRNASPNILMIGTPKGAKRALLNDLVTKYGATTSLTNGQVESTSLTVNIAGLWFYYQYRIMPQVPGAAFSQPGDSGAAVIDSDLFAIGLVIAGDGRQTIVNPIVQIMDALSVSMPPP